MGCLSRGSLPRAVALILFSLLSSESSPPETPAGAASSVAFPDSPLAIAAAERSALCSSPPCSRRVIIGFSNMGYRKFTLNWVNSPSRTPTSCVGTTSSSPPPSPTTWTAPLLLGASLHNRLPLLRG